MLLKRKVITHTDSSKHQRLLLTWEGRGGEGRGGEGVSIDRPISFCCLQDKVRGGGGGGEPKNATKEESDYTY